MRIRFRPDWRHPGVRKALALSGWTVGYVVANQVAAQTVNVLAEPGSGDVTNYNVAFMFFQLPHGLLAVSLMTTFQPDLARAAVHRDWSAFHGRLLLGLRLLSLVVVPGGDRLPGAHPHRHGAAEATGCSLDGADAAGRRILGGFALGLIGFSTYLFVLRAFYAMQDTRTPVHPEPASRTPSTSSWPSSSCGRSASSGWPSPTPSPTRSPRCWRWPCSSSATPASTLGGWSAPRSTSSCPACSWRLRSAAIVGLLPTGDGRR